MGALIGWNASALAGFYTTDTEVRRIAGVLLLIIAFYHPADALQAVMAQVLRGYKHATVPMVIYVLALWGIGLSGGYLLGLTDLIVAPLGAAGFWISATAGLTVAGLAVTFYFLKISARQPN